MSEQQQLPTTSAALPEAKPSAPLRKQIDERVAKVQALRNLYGKKTLEKAQQHLQRAADMIGTKAAIDLLRL